MSMKFSCVKSHFSLHATAGVVLNARQLMAYAVVGGLGFSATWMPGRAAAVWLRSPFYDVAVTWQAKP